MTVYKCYGEGHGSCARCNERDKWNMNWMCFLYEIRGLDGCYCWPCVLDIAKERGINVDPYHTKLADEEGIEVISR